MAGAIHTDDVHARARVTHVSTEELLPGLLRGEVSVVTGFQGVAASGRITTLGRGGSDTTAVALAAALDADICDIYTDVEGVYTADPRWVPCARKLTRMTYAEMLETASLGAKILQACSVEMALNYGVRLQVRSSFSWWEPLSVVSVKLWRRSSPWCCALRLKPRLPRGYSSRPGAWQVFYACCRCRVSWLIWLF